MPSTAHPITAHPITAEGPTAAQAPPLPGSVPNRLRQAAESALAAAVRVRDDVTEAFDALFAEADPDGWAGRAADDWWHGAADQRAGTLRTVDAWVEACRHRLRAEPAQVAADDPRAHHPGPADPAPAPRAGLR